MVNHCALFVGTLITENQVIATPGKRKIKKTISNHSSFLHNMFFAAMM